MRHAIYSLNGEFLASYEGDRDETSRFRSHLLCPPNAIHLEVPEGMDEECLELYDNPGIPGQAYEPDMWVRGDELVYEAPADLTGWTYVAGKPEIIEVPPFKAVRESESLKLNKKQRLANSVLGQIRHLRNALLSAADVEIYKLEDLGQDASLMRSYRVQLRNCTDSLKNEDGSAKLECADIVAENYLFPVKP